MLIPVDNRQGEMERRRFLLEILVNMPVKPLFIGPFQKTLLITLAAQVSYIQPEKAFSEEKENGSSKW